MVLNAQNDLIWDGKKHCNPLFYKDLQTIINLTFDFPYVILVPRNGILVYLIFPPRQLGVYRYEC
jgi:hypothetical protein